MIDEKKLLRELNFVAHNLPCGIEGTTMELKNWIEKQPKISTAMVQKKKAYPPHYIGHTISVGMIYGFRCPNEECGRNVAKEYVCCPYCETRLDWKYLEKELTDSAVKIKPNSPIDFSKDIDNPLVKRLIDYAEKNIN